MWKLILIAILTAFIQVGAFLVGIHLICKGYVVTGAILALAFIAALICYAKKAITELNTDIR